jgi:hypothetical protein
MKRRTSRKAEQKKTDAEGKTSSSGLTSKGKISKPKASSAQSRPAKKSQKAAAKTPIAAEAKPKQTKIPGTRTRRVAAKRERAVSGLPASETSTKAKASPVVEPPVVAKAAPSVTPPIEKHKPAREISAQSRDLPSGEATGRQAVLPLWEQAPSEAKLAAPPRPSLPPTFKLPVPAILLEGDQAEPPPKAGPGEKFAVGATPLKQVSEAGQLLPGYGTGRVSTIARDPYCLFVSWDFTDAQQRYYNSLSADNHLVLRAHDGSLSGPVATEAHLHGETRHWFVHVPRAAAQYVVEIGYYLLNGAWTTVRSSEPVTTQPDRPSEDQTVRFAYAPSFAPSVEWRAEPPLPGPLLQGGRIDEIEKGWEAHPTITTPVLPESRPPVQYPQWTAAQEEALTELISTMIRREQVPGSLEILELLQRQMRRQILPLEEQIGLPGPSSAALGISSLPAEQEIPSSLVEAERLPPRKGFWFNVNAELIIYGATEPDARVTIGGRAIKLRPDGTFSYRFALPDGYYELPAQATSADQSDSRRAELRFSRQTAYSGDVGAHPQDKALQTPAPENVA